MRGDFGLCFPLNFSLSVERSGQRPAEADVDGGT